MFLRRSADTPEKKAGLFQKLKQALGATRDNLVRRIDAVLSSDATIDESTLDELEEILLGADLGVRVTTRLMAQIREQHRKYLVRTPAELRTSIRRLLRETLEVKEAGAVSATAEPEVWMIVGVNGTGKTTTVGKLAARMSKEGKRVLVCAADTYRPAAIEQLAIWVERSGVDLVKSKTGSDPSAVLHDALAAASARGKHIVIVDTAGRLHTRSNLMLELEKMRRVAGRQIPAAPHEVFLVLDATTGQNGLSQAREFTKSAGVTGLIVTKLDGTAKGGVLFSICQDLKIPVRYVGVGESIEDLLEFNAEAFVDSLFAEAPLES
jgi:fused signal recognition particle receptor